MQGFELKAIDSQLKVGVTTTIVAGGRNQYTATVSVNDTWSGKALIVDFNGYKEVIDETFVVNVPTDSLTGTSLEITIIGVEEDESYTTNTVSVPFVNGVMVADTTVPSASEWEQYVSFMNDTLSEAKQYAEDADTSATEADETLTAVNEKASEFYEEAETSQQKMLDTLSDVSKVAEEADMSAQNAKVSEENANTSEEEAENSAAVAVQAMTDLLAMLGTDIPTLIDGKIPISYIPSTATQEIYTISDPEELTSLVAQKGDLAHLIETLDGVETIVKTWQLLGESSVFEDWVVWGTSYSVLAGSATYAETASNALMINNKRIVSMTAEQYATAVKDEDTYYFVNDEV